MILFAADLHLSASTPGLIGLFKAFLDFASRGATELFLLGDVFEFWAGDDDVDNPTNAEIVAALRAAVDNGLSIGFIHGNRDFLIGSAFAAASGVRLLPDPHVVSVPEWQFVLTHGDQLCTDDAEYQAFRRMVRGPQWQSEFLALPLGERHRQIEAVRRASEESKSRKAEFAPMSMDVNGAAADDFLRQNGYVTLIHGHTHRPRTHDHMVDGIHCERWVLSDWHEGGNDSVGEALAWRDGQLERLAVRF